MHSKANIGWHLILIKPVATNYIGLFLKGGGSINEFKSLPGYIKDVWPALIILTTNWCQLDRKPFRRKFVYRTAMKYGGNF